ncbi:hypothetical protein BgiMline_001872, partial [Biomphalaria glabrata]
ISTKVLLNTGLYQCVGSNAQQVPPLTDVTWFRSSDDVNTKHEISTDIHKTQWVYRHRHQLTLYVTSYPRDFLSAPSAPTHPRASKFSDTEQTNAIAEMKR